MAKSSAKLKAASEPTRARFQALEDVSIFRCVLKKRTNLASQSGERDPRSSEELETELGALQAQLDMNMHTNAGVVEQYEQRQREVCCTWRLSTQFWANLSDRLLNYRSPSRN